MINKGDSLTLTITDLNNLGCGVGRAEDGRVVFVQGAVDGDTVEAKVIKVTSSYFVAKLEKILIPSQYRRESVFCAAPESCGGCIYRNLTYERELELKREYVRHCFKKAGLDGVTVEDVRTTGTVRAYRNKAEYPFASSKDGIYAGFYAPKTHRVVKAECCSLQPEVFSQILRFTCEFMTQKGVSVYDERTQKGVLRHLYLRIGQANGNVMVCPVINADLLECEAEYVSALTEKFPCVSTVLLNVNKKNTNLVLGDKYRTLYGNGYLTDTLCGLEFNIAPSSFYQVNHDGAELLYSIAADKAKLSGGELLLDLYCGAGTIGLSMASFVREVIGIEIVSAAVECAKENARLNGIENASFYCADAGNAEQLLSSAESVRNDRINPDVVILDPPRKGCDRALLEFLARKEIKTIVYVSCGPDTLARDCAILQELGYTVGDVTPVDMFPRTGHVESVVCLTRSDKAT